MKLIRGIWIEKWDYWKDKCSRFRVWKLSLASQRWSRSREQTALGSVLGVNDCSWDYSVDPVALTWTPMSPRMLLHLKRRRKTSSFLIPSSWPPNGFRVHSSLKLLFPREMDSRLPAPIDTLRIHLTFLPNIVQHIGPCCPSWNTFSPWFSKDPQPGPSSSFPKCCPASFPIEMASLTLRCEGSLLSRLLPPHTHALHSPAGSTAEKPANLMSTSHVHSRLPSSRPPAWQMHSGVSITPLLRCSKLVSWWICPGRFLPHLSRWQHLLWRCVARRSGAITDTSHSLSTLWSGCHGLAFYRWRKSYWASGKVPSCAQHTKSHFPWDIWLETSFTEFKLSACRRQKAT